MGKIIIGLSALALLCACTGEQEPPESQSLGDTSWVLSKYQKVSGLWVEPALSEKMTLQFDMSRGITGFVDCNSYSAGYVTSNSLLEVTEAAQTRIACGESGESDAVLALLVGESSFEVVDDELHITRGDQELVFERRFEGCADALVVSPDFGSTTYRIELAPDVDPEAVGELFYTEYADIEIGGGATCSPGFQVSANFHTLEKLRCRSEITQIDSVDLALVQ